MYLSLRDPAREIEVLDRDALRLIVRPIDRLGDPKRCDGSPPSLADLRARGDGTSQVTEQVAEREVIEMKRQTTLLAAVVVALVLVATWASTATVSKPKLTFFTAFGDQAERVCRAVHGFS